MTSEPRHEALLTESEPHAITVSLANNPQQVPANTSILIINQPLIQQFGIDVFREQAPQAVVIAEYCNQQPITDQDVILLPEGMPDVFLNNALTRAVQQLTLQRQLDASRGDMQQGSEQLARVLEIGTALSAELDHQKLLARILTEARELACCDAASLFLVERHDAQGKRARPELVFKLTQNDSIDFHFEERRFELSAGSVAGFAALTGEVVNLDDVYQLPKHTVYKFNSAFDESMNYRTRSMLVIPMRNHSGEVIGVIQFINRKTDSSVKLDDPDKAMDHTISFSDDVVPLLKALASQAAVAIENNLLIERVNMLFDGFVKASVRAIEQRDPTTSGHSFRVAELTCRLAQEAIDCGAGRFANTSMNAAEMKELRFAALLHDFGKVGVREHVLTKAKKLTPEAYGQFVYRIAWEKERIRNHYLTRRLGLMKQSALSSDMDEKLALEEAAKLQRLNDYLQAVADANEPSLLAEGTFEHLKQVREYMVEDVHGVHRGLIEEAEFQALSVKRGSLTTDERLEIESHVSHTIEFLNTIPWTPELSRVPAIAGAHHEKLNGCGYPYGLKEADIPLGAKMMTICDIFDALTATDRPYKAAVPLERALSILQSEVECGHVDVDLVRLFCETKAYQVLDL